MRNLRFVLVFGLLVGCGDSTNPSASGVFPAEGFAGRSLRVEISGDATSWSDGAVVNFGAGVTVSNVMVASPTDLFADVTIDSAAAEGLQDVSVSSGGTYTLKQAFQVKSPVELAFEGGVEQGGLPYFTLTNHDFDTPFDLTADANGNLLNTTLVGPAGTNFHVDSQTTTAYQIKGYVFIDGDAAPGSLTVKSGPTGSQVTSIVSTVDIKTRAATPLTSGTPVTGMITDVGDTLWYSLASSGGLVHLSATVSSQSANPGVAILDGGKWASSLGGTYAILDTAKTVNIAVLDNGTASGYSVNLTATSEALTSAAEPNAPTDDAVGSAITATFPYRLTGATISAAGDKDYIKVVVTAAEATKHLHVITTAGDDPLTDTSVDIVDASNASKIGGASDDSFTCILGGVCGEDVVAPALAAGTYYILVTDGGAYDPADKSYVLVAWFE
jgi:hypothetical protein